MTVPFTIDPVEVRVNGRWPLLMPPHRAERPEWHTPPYWEGRRLTAMRDELERYDRPVVWDIGAEEGDMPALYATWGAGVVLVEPNPKVWPCIRYHWTVNQLDPPLGCYVGMVGSAPNERAAHGEWMIWPDCAQGDMNPAHGFHHLREHAEVDPVTTLDVMLASFPAPDVITVDIEGGEGLMLQGARTMLEDVRPVWFLSVHSFELRELYGHNPSEHVHEVMEAHGYTGEFVEDRHEAHWVYRP